MSKTIYLIRHCQKDDNSGKDLSKEGIVYAKLLAEHFEKEISPVPQVILSQAPADLLDKEIRHTSNRPYETALTIAHKLKSSVVTRKSWSHEAIEEIVKAIHETKEEVILVVWEHHMLPEIAAKLINSKDTFYWNYNPEKKAAKHQDIYDLLFIIKHGQLTANKLPKPVG